MIAAGAQPQPGTAIDADELDALDDALVAIARGGQAEPVEQDLGELVVAAAVRER